MIMRVGVVGGGISGLVAALELARHGARVTLYEKEDYLGGHAKTVSIHEADDLNLDLDLDLDLGFMVFNRVTYPNMLEWLEGLGVEMETSDMPFSVSIPRGGGYEWGSRNGLSGLFAQRTNALKPLFWFMLREILKFKQDVPKYLEDHENNPVWTAMRHWDNSFSPLDIPNCFRRLILCFGLLCLLRAFLLP